MRFFPFRVYTCQFGEQNNSNFMLMTHARDTGRLVKRPNSIEAKPDMAAVAVMSSLCRSVLLVRGFYGVLGLEEHEPKKICSPIMQREYSSSFVHVGSSSLLQIHVPPL